MILLNLFSGTAFTVLSHCCTTLTGVHDDTLDSKRKVVLGVVVQQESYRSSITALSLFSDKIFFTTLFSLKKSPKKEINVKQSYDLCVVNYNNLEPIERLTIFSLSCGKTINKTSTLGWGLVLLS